MSGRSRCLSAVVLALCLGASWACWAEEKSTERAQPQAGSVSGLEILKRPPAPKKGEKTSPEAAIRRALETRVRVEFDEVSLQDMCGAIGKQLGIPVVLDRRALDDEGLDLETPVSCSMNNARLRSFLDLMLSYNDLTWTIHREVLLITTTSAAQEMLETRVYDVTDLAAASKPGHTDLDSLVELITTTISPESWQDVGGGGSIAIIDEKGIQAIAIFQTSRIHDEIEKLLAALRAHIPKKTVEKDKNSVGGKSKVSETRAVVKSKSDKALSEEETVRQALRKKVDLNFNETPLPEVVEQLKKLLQIEIQLHKRSLEDEGLDPETPISFQVSGISAASAMDLILRDLDLTYTIKDDFLLILTTAAEEELSLNVKVYDVADLAGDYGVYSSCDYLIPAITSTIGPACWTTVGGEGSIDPFENAGMRVLVVGQTQRIQDDIKKLLSDLRKVQREVDDAHVSPLGVGPDSGMPRMGGSRSRRRRPVLDIGPFGTPMSTICAPLPAKAPVQ